jgi:signal peptidase I
VRYIINSPLKVTEKTLENNPEPVTPEINKTDKTQSSMTGFFWEVFQTLAMALILFFLVDTFLARARVENISMLPNLREGNFLLVNKFAYTWGKLQRGDIIVFHYRLEPGADYIKRLVGLPGDDIKIEQDKTYINGQLISEPYLAKPGTYRGEWKVPEGMFFALGDNRDVSKDSHEFGFIPISDLVGRAIFIYYPFDQIRTLNDTINVN